MLLWILRGVFLLAAVGVGFAVINAPTVGAPGVDAPTFQYPWLVFVAIVVIAVGIIGLDAATPRKRIDIVSCVYFGILIGLFLTMVVGVIIEPLLTQLESTEYDYSLRLVVGTMLCYFCVSMLVQTRDDFRFIIPYVEFSKEVKGVKPYLLDTSIVIDGRIADLVETGVFDNTLVMPRFVLAELQAIADSSDKMRRSRGRRGLDILNRLRTGGTVELRIHDRETPEMAGQPVDMKLVLLAKHLSGKVVTGDYNLNKVAKIHGVGVINLNDVANSLKPVYLPGEHLDVRVVKPGEEQGQGVGYLDDGTMIVIEGGRDYVNQNVRIAVTSVLQTSAGRMIFGKYEGGV
ncbi:MAG: PIN/TRAM domain-containing protein [Planctomycetes bacterium]|nr:PIN/TRAM domain-containing protein [Planctomycetota bacterium]